MMFEVITLDLDDTLWDSRPALLRAERLHYHVLRNRRGLFRQYRS